MSCLLIFLRVIYSLKVSVISSLSKKVVFIFGDALIKIGGIESLGPPVGEDLLAHCKVHNSINPKSKSVPIYFIFRKYFFL